MRSWAGKPVMSSPKKRMVPDVTGKSPVMQLNNVVLPAPFDPSTPRRSPGRTLSVMSVSAASAPNMRVTPRSSSAFAVPAADNRSGNGGAAGTGRSDSGVSNVVSISLRACQVSASHARDRDRALAPALPRPKTPSGDQKTITRKPRPMRSWKRSAGRPTLTRMSRAKVRRRT